MKRLLIAIAILASFQVANAQVKQDAAKKAVAACEAASQNAKKAAKSATWLKLGKAYLDAYDAPTGGIWAGASKAEVGLILGAEKPSATEQVELGGEQMIKEVYANMNLFFNVNGQLSVIEVTKPIVEDVLDKAADAYRKAFKLDPKKAAEVTAAIKDINGKYVQDAYNYYTLGDLATSSVYFEKAANVFKGSAEELIDTNSVYNAGFTANLAGDKERAKKMFLQCLDYGYYAENGELFAKLADVDPENTKRYLEDGFKAFPESQSILIGLINYYLQNNENPETLFGLLDQAKQNEPNNASLYYVEGNIRTQLGQFDEAVAAYEKCNEIDSKYEYGFIGEGIMFYNQAIDIQTKAQDELDDAKYMALVAEFEASLKNCIAPFEKAFTLCGDDSVKVSIAEYLKNAYYRFISEDASFKEAYDKYAAIVASGSAN